jgi:hypothetical protein
MTSTAATATPTRLQTRARSATGRGVVLGLAFALAADSIVYAIGNAGAPIRVVTGWSSSTGKDISFGEVVGTCLVSIVLGGLLLSWMLRRRADGLRRWIVVAAAVAIVSAIPLYRLDIDTGSKIALSSMHLLTGAAAIVAQLITRRGSGPAVSAPTR